MIVPPVHECRRPFYYVSSFRQHERKRSMSRSRFSALFLPPSLSTIPLSLSLSISVFLSPVSVLAHPYPISHPSSFPLAHHPPLLIVTPRLSLSASLLLSFSFYFSLFLHVVTCTHTYVKNAIPGEIKRLTEKHARLQCRISVRNIVVMM